MPHIHLMPKDDYVLGSQEVKSECLKHTSIQEALTYVHLDL